MVRFVLGPDGAIAPDVAEKLPGRGVWITADRASLEKAAKKNVFSRSLKSQVRVQDDLVDLVERLLIDRAISTLSLARKAGLAITGFEKVREAADRAIALVQAFDGADDGKRKLRRLFPDRTEITCLTGDELGLAFGRAYAIHAALESGGASTRFIREAARLRGVRQLPLRDGAATSDDLSDHR